MKLRGFRAGDAEGQANDMAAYQATQPADDAAGYGRVAVPISGGKVCSPASQSGDSIVKPHDGKPTLQVVAERFINATPLGVSYPRIRSPSHDFTLVQR